MIELVPLARATATLSPPLMLPNTPAGMRIIFEISDYRFEGERFAARQRGAAAADWLVVGPEGTATLDVRATLETHDGALVLLRYSGRVDASRGPALDLDAHAAGLPPVAPQRQDSVAARAATMISQVRHARPRWEDRVRHRRGLGPRARDRAHLRARRRPSGGERPPRRGGRRGAGGAGGAWGRHLVRPARGRRLGLGARARLVRDARANHGRAARRAGQQRGLRRRRPRDACAHAPADR